MQNIAIWSRWNLFLLRKFVNMTVGFFKGGWVALGTELSEADLGRFDRKRSMILIINQTMNKSDDLRHERLLCDKKAKIMQTTILVSYYSILRLLVNFCNDWSTFVTTGQLDLWSMFPPNLQIWERSEIAICRGKQNISRFVARNVRYRGLSR